MAKLFESYKLKDITFRNRLAVSPMCQYMATDGVPNDWHHVHYASHARGGAGLVVVEATAVSPEGRISPHCLGLWNDEQAQAFEPIVRQIKKAGAVPGIQIAHAGRKANANVPWEGDDHIAESDPRAWEIIAPSAVAFGANLPRVPRAMTGDDIKRVQHAFVESAIRALNAGFELLMLHFAHGYLAQSFWSPHANRREDEYGGSAANRGRFLLETLRAVRKVWPENKPLIARFGMIEFDGRDEEMLAESIDLATRFRTEGLDLLDVSLGFNTPDAKIPWGPAFMVPVAGRVRRESGLPTATSWYLGEAHLCEKALQDEQIDMVMSGRPILANPHWPYEAAQALKVENLSGLLPPPYAHWLARYRKVSGL